MLRFSVVALALSSVSSVVNSASVVGGEILDHIPQPHPFAQDLDIPPAAQLRVGAGDCTSSCSACTDEFSCLDVLTPNTDCVWGAPLGDYSIYNDDVEDSICRDRACIDVGNEGGYGDASVECASALNGDCQWYDSSYVCFDKDKALPCEFAADTYTKAACDQYGSDNKLSCSWVDYDDKPSDDQYDGQCKSSSAIANIECGHFNQDDACSASTSCKWYEEDIPGTNGNSEYCSSCYPSTLSEPSCRALENEPKACCPQDRCHWVTTMSNEGGGNDDEYDGKCLEQNEQPACELFSSGDLCEDESGGKCRWLRYDEYDGRCIGADEPVSCYSLNKALCGQAALCDFVSQSCVACPAGKNCTAPAPGQQDCEKYTAATCPDGDGFCTLKFPDISTGGDPEEQWQCGPGGGSAEEGTCANSTCGDIWDQTTCGEKSSCQWNEEFYSCIDPSNPDCSQIYEKEQCNSVSQYCDFKTNAQILPNSPCADDTGGDEEFGVCFKKGGNPKCDQLDAYEADCCPSFCSFSDGMCNEKGGGGGGDDVDCESYGTTPPNAQDGGCPASCNFGANTKFICTSKTSLACKDICSLFACEGTGQDNKATNCKWVFDNPSDPYTGTCSDSSTPLQACKAKSESECETDPRCRYFYNSNYDSGVCYEAVCSTMEQEVCKANEPDCSWDSENYVCSFPNIKTQCNTFYSEDCPSDRCKEFTSLCDGEEYDTFCAEKDATDKNQLPCSVFDNKDCCNGLDHCEFDEDKYTCHVKGADLPAMPVLNGAGNHDPKVCENQQGSNFYNLVDIALTDAAQDCGGSEYDYNNGVATDDQIKCLAYYVQNSASSTFTTICPCLYLWALEISPEDSHWMAINC